MTWPGKALADSFYERPVLDVAPDLLNKVLVRGSRAVRITEVEAYAGEDDAGSHCWRGITPRTTVMFGPPGHWYTYLSYGVHWCANVVVDVDGRASAVLLRGAEPLAGIDEIRARRGDKTRDRHLVDGPGKLGQAMDVDAALYGQRIAESPLRIIDDANPPPSTPTRTTRIGLSEGRGQDLPWRFTV